MTHSVEKIPDQARGTYTHIPPEVFIDINTKPDYSRDVYAFAITVWEIFTGNKPFGKFFFLEKPFAIIYEMHEDGGCKSVPSRICFLLIGPKRTQLFNLETYETNYFYLSFLTGLSWFENEIISLLINHGPAETCHMSVILALYLNFKRKV